MLTGFGIDPDQGLSQADELRVVRLAAELGYESAWTNAGPDAAAFERCRGWHLASGLPVGISAVPAPGQPPAFYADHARQLWELTGGHFTLVVGSGLLSQPAKKMPAYLGELRTLLPAGAPLYLAALGPLMLTLAGELSDGVALNWCSADQVRWSRERVAAGARAAGRDPSDVRIHEYIRVCIDEDEEAARIAFATMVLTYALARPGADKTKGYRGHFSRMGFDAVLTNLESRRVAGASEHELARSFPVELLRLVGYWGRPEGAREAFLGLAASLDIAVVRLVPARRNDLAAVRLAAQACAPKS